MPVLTESFYKPARGGHAPGDVRQAFADALDAYWEWEEGEPEPMIMLRDQPVSISAVCGLLWNCVDWMPNRLIDQMRDSSDPHLPTPSYAAGARWLKAEIAAAKD
jgi:hypothetical protein